MKYTLYSSKMNSDIFERQALKRGVSTLDYIYQILSDEALKLSEREAQGRRAIESLGYRDITS